MMPSVVLNTLQGCARKSVHNTIAALEVCLPPFGVYVHFDPLDFAGVALVHKANRNAVGGSGRAPVRSNL